MFHAGMRFTHDSFLDPTWTPGVGQTLKDSPKAQMVVTRVTRARVYYGYLPADGTKPVTGWGMDTTSFADRFWGSVQEHLEMANG